LTYPVDLQVHSVYSDGTMTPAELVAHAVERGVCVLALTDHDSVKGVPEVLAAGAEAGIEIVPAVELSIRHEPERDFVDLDILGYWIDHTDPGLQAMIQKVINGRVAQKIRQIEIMQSYGIDVPVEEVLALAKGVPGRPHIAQVVMKHNPGRFRDVQEIFDEFLSAGARAHVPRPFSLTVEMAVELISNAGGIPVLAHPGIYKGVRDVDNMIRRVAALGVRGLEVWYAYKQNRTHQGISDAEIQAMVAHFETLADKLGLLKTGGSDFHGARKPGLEIGDGGMTLDAYKELKTKVFASRSQPVLAL